MYQDTIFTIEIHPDMFHDTVSLACRPVFSALCVYAVARALLLLFGHSNTPDVSSQGSLSKVSNVETSQLKGIPCHEWYSVPLEVRSSLCWCGQGVLSFVADQVGNLEFLCCVPGAISWYEGEGVS